MFVLALNSDLVAKASALGINISRTAEAAVIAAFEAMEKEKIREELREGIRMTDEYVAIHGMPFDDWANGDTSADDTDHAA